ncbi:MAG: hypothetical protein Kow00117_14840 [Phototrophicales bacterium]
MKRLFTLMIFSLLMIHAWSVSAQSMVTIDPDGYPDETNISHAFAGVTLSAIGGNATSNNVYSTNVWCASQQGFGLQTSFGIEARFDQNNTDLRVDFDTPTNNVEVDIVVSSDTAPQSTLGFVVRPMLQQGGVTLTAYNASGSPVDQHTASYGIITLSVSTQADEIAYVVVSHNGNTGDCYGIMQIRYHTTDETLICGQVFRIYGMVRIDEQMMGYGQPGRDVIRQADNSLLPILHDVDGDGYDTYLIIDEQNYDNQVWYGLFLGGCQPVYVPAEKVIRLY